MKKYCMTCKIFLITLKKCDFMVIFTLKKCNFAVVFTLKKCNFKALQTE